MEHVCEEAQSKTSILLEYVCEKNKIYKPSMFFGICMWKNQNWKTYFWRECAYEKTKFKPMSSDSNGIPPTKIGEPLFFFL